MLTRKQLDQNFKIFLQAIESIKEKYSQSVEYNLVNQNISLIAVSKQHPFESILELYNLGQKQFGESYLQEAITKINMSHKLGLSDIIWHYIGRIQSNKTKLIAENFAWVHSVESLKIAERFNLQRPKHLDKLNILLQINIDQDLNKSGIIFEPVNNQKSNSGAIQTNELDNIITEILKLENIILRGFMCILEKSSSTDNSSDRFQQQYNSFKKLTELLRTINKNHNLNLDTLSMGMSNDYEAAIAAGSNMIRIGSALFGPRPSSTS